MRVYDAIPGAPRSGRFPRAGDIVMRPDGLAVVTRVGEATMRLVDLTFSRDQGGDDWEDERSLQMAQPSTRAGLSVTREAYALLAIISDRVAGTSMSALVEAVAHRFAELVGAALPRETDEEVEFAATLVTLREKQQEAIGRRSSRHMEAWQKAIAFSVEATAEVDDNALIRWVERGMPGMDPSIPRQHLIGALREAIVRGDHRR